MLEDAGENAAPSGGKSSLLPVSLEGSPARFWVGTAPRRVVMFGGEPLSHLLPGWSAKFVYTSLAPIFLLELEHQDGLRSTWFLNENMEYLSNNAAELGAEYKAHLGRCVGDIARNLWDDIMVSVAPPDPRLFDHSDFYCINETARGALGSLYYDAAPPTEAMDVVSALDAAHRRFVVSGTGGDVILNADRLRGTLKRRITDENFRLCVHGEFNFPSPVDGHELGAEHGLYLDANVWAYKVIDKRWGYSFFIIAFEGEFRTFAIYFPRDHLIICLDDFGRWVVMDRVPDLTRRLYKHLLAYGDVLPAYYSSKTSRSMHIMRGVSSMHIGHTLWNDLSGITHLVEAVPKQSLPLFGVFDVEHVPEMFGALDRIFPEIEGRVIRYKQGFVTITRQLYADKLRLIKATTNYVPRSIGVRILSAAVAAPENAADVAAIEKMRNDGELVVYVNVRVENRTMVDPAAFCESLVDLFAARPASTTVIIDGHDRRKHDDPSWMYASVNENNAKREPISIERELAERMRVRALGTRVTIVSMVGTTIAQSLLWCQSSHFFVATWGAALAKCRWVCNKPGLVLSNRVNLITCGDLPIYSAEEFNENPAPIRFIDPSAITDEPQSSQVIKSDRQFFDNFTVDMTVLPPLIDDMIRTFYDTGNRPHNRSEAAGALQEKAGWETRE